MLDILPPQSYQRNPLLHRWLQVVQEFNSQPAILAPDGTCLLSFSDIEHLSNLWAERFNTIKASRPAITLEIPNNPLWPAILLAVLKAGAVAILGRPPAKGIIETHATVTLASSGNPSLQQIPTAGAPIPNTVDLVKLTSGSEATPKFIAFSAAQLLADAANIHATMRIAPPDRNIAAIPMSHSYGLSNLFCLLVAEAVPIILCDPMPRPILQAMQCARGSVLPIVPALVRALSQLQADSGTLRLCISAGAPLSASDAAAFYHRFSRKVHSFYGASECGGICFDSTDNPFTPDGFVGTPLAGVRLSLLPGPQKHQIRVHSGAVAIGLIGQNSPTFFHGTFQPSDLLEPTPDGYKILGRLSDWINLSGRKIAPSEIETHLRKVPGITDCAVLGLPSPTAHGETIATVYVGTLAPETARAACRGLVPHHLIPRRWLRVSSLPINERGKLQRNLLRELFK